MGHRTEDSAAVDLARLLESGRAVVTPTDTVLGLLSLSEEPIVRAKGRDPSKRTVRFVDHHSRLPQPLPEDLRSLLELHWPGALTVVYRGVGYRCPNCPHILGALRILGRFIYASSANLSSRPVAKSLEEARRIFRDGPVEVEYLDLPIIGSGRASTVYDYDGGRVLRRGEVPIRA